MKKIQKLFQIATAAEPIRTEAWSPGFKMNVESFKNNYPDADYHLYQDSDLSRNGRVPQACQHLKPVQYLELVFGNWFPGAGFR